MMSAWSRRINGKAYNVFGYIIVVVGMLLLISGLCLLAVGLIR